MKPNPVAFFVLPVVLAACSAPQSAAPVQAEAKPEPGVTMPAPPAGTTSLMAGFRAFGNEPFWNIKVEGDTLTLTTPEDQRGMLMQGARRVMTGGVELTGSHDGTPFALTVTAGECSDGMSDNRYQMVSNFRHGDIDYTGCAELAK